MSISQHHPGRSLVKGRKISRLRLAGTAVLAGAMAMTAFVGTSGAAKAKVKAHAATVKPDFAFFQGKVITWIVPGAPGSAQDQYFRAMQPSLEATLGATINEEIIPGNQIIAADEIGHSDPTGLIIGTQGIGSALYNQLVDVTPESFSLQKMTYFGALHNTPLILVSCAGSGVTSLDQLIHSTTQITYLDFPSPAGVIFHTLLNAYGANVRYLTGYTAPTLTAGCIRGDGTVAAGYITTLIANPSSFPAGETLLATSTKFVAGTATYWMNSVPSSTTVAAYIAKHPIKNTVNRRALNIALQDTAGGPLTTVYGPGGIAPGKVAALTAAVKKATLTPAVKTALLNLGIPPGYMAASTIIPFVKKQVYHFPIIRKFVLGNGVND